MWRRDSVASNITTVLILLVSINQPINETKIEVNNCVPIMGGVREVIHTGRKKSLFRVCCVLHGSQKSSHLLPLSQRGECYYLILKMKVGCRQL